MGIDNFFDGDIYDRFAKGHHVRVFIDIEFLLWFRNITCCLKKVPKRK